MNKEVEKIYKRKIQEFQKHNKLYYDKSAPAISDSEFDKLKADIINLEKKYFELIINNFPKTDYAEDSKYKLEYIIEIIASKEMYLARYYVQREKWIPAINRFKTVINDYETTIYVEEALHRLVELHYKLGLVNESKKYASLLGYNYQSSEWYEESYKILNKNYVKRAKKGNTEKERSILQKFKDLLK